MYIRRISPERNASGRRNASSGEMSMIIRDRNQKMPIGRITDRNGYVDCGGGGRTIGTFKRICIVSTSRRPMCASGYVLLYIRIYRSTSVRPCPTSISVYAASAAATQHYNMYPLLACTRSPGSHSLLPSTSPVRPPVDGRARVSPASVQMPNNRLSARVALFLVTVSLTAAYLDSHSSRRIYMYMYYIIYRLDGTPP